MEPIRIVWILCNVLAGLSLTLALTDGWAWAVTAVTAFLAQFLPEFVLEQVDEQEQEPGPGPDQEGDG